jgi:hypothetical protein
MEAVVGTAVEFVAALDARSFFSSIYSLFCVILFFKLDHRYVQMRRELEERGPVMEDD